MNKSKYTRMTCFTINGHALVFWGQEKVFCRFYYRLAQDNQSLLSGMVLLLSFSATETLDKFSRPSGYITWRIFFSIIDHHRHTKQFHIFD